MGAMNMFPPSLLASRRQTACFAQTVDIRDKTQAGFAQIVGIILQQIVTKVCESYFLVLLYRHLIREIMAKNSGRGAHETAAAISYLRNKHGD